MTVVATRAKLAVVHVIRTMTSAAGSRYGASAAGSRIGMAGVARKSGMGAVQREGRGGTVIERACRPGVAGMAGAAILTERSAVGIIVRVTTGAVLWRSAEDPVGVAPGTGNGGMNPEQREFGHIMIKAHRFRPGRLAMASRAFAGELCLVNVIECVTAVAGSRRRILHPGLVAGRAIERCMRLLECESRAGVIETARCPAGGIVAACAIRTEPALVRVIGPVAGFAPGSKIVPVISPGMAVRALELRMTVLECEARDARMIKPGARPGIGRMAAATICSALTRVHIVHGVAACARRRRLVKTIALVTIAARDLVVRAGQRIARKRVVENCIPPGGLGMTGAAGGAELSLVNVSILVTGAARQRGIAHRCSGCMTILAGRADVCAL